MEKRHTFLMIIYLLSTTVDSRMCPEECKCYEKQKKVYTVCDKGGLTEIPTAEISRDTQVLIITAPKHKPNYLTIGRIFLSLEYLEEIRIVHSNLPAIGDSSFWPGKNLLLLDLSHNNISIIRDSDFSGLENLQVLNLSYNHIAVIPSAPFRLLTSLKILSLAKNRLHALVPRFFYLLPKLEILDLSYNPLNNIDPEYMKDVKPLKKLILMGCHLTRLHSLIYQQLPNLEILDLRNNNFKVFSPEEFRYLRKLRVLRLDGNNLTVIVEKTFDGHNLKHLGLSKNKIHTFSPCAFCNTSVHDLDLSYNKLTTLNVDVLGPLVPSLEVLNLEHNPLTSKMVSSVLKLLYKVDSLNLAGIGLSHLPEDTFSSNRMLKHLNMSYNSFSNISHKLLSPLRSLELLDLSNNDLRGLYPKLLQQFHSLTNLTVLQLNNNPWSCQLCVILPMLLWNSTLHRCNSEVNCLRCAQPPHLAGRSLHSLEMDELPPCMVSLTQPRILTATSNVGVAVAVTAIVIFLLLIVVIIILYRQQGAVYYTHEEQRTQEFSYDTYADRNGGDKRLSFITMDKIDDPIDDRFCVRMNAR